MRDHLDRLLMLEMAEPTRLKALVERHLPTLDILAQLTGDGLDIEALRLRLARLPATAEAGPATAPAPESSPAPAPSTSVGDYLSDLVALVDPRARVLPDGEPVRFPAAVAAQTHIGPHRLFYIGNAGRVLAQDEVGAMHTSVTDDTSAANLPNLGGTHLHWRERLVTADPVAWLDGRVRLESTGAAYQTWQDVDTRARADHRKAADGLLTTIAALPGAFADKPRLYAATMDFQYVAAPTADEVVEPSPPKGLQRRLFRVLSDAGNQSGLLLREILPLGAGSHVVDHWVLGKTYKPPQKDVGLTLERDDANLPSNLKAFFTYAHQKNLASLYAQTAYSFTPV